VPGRLTQAVRLSGTAAFVTPADLGAITGVALALIFVALNLSRLDYLWRLVHDRDGFTILSSAIIHSLQRLFQKRGGAPRLRDVYPPWRSRLLASTPDLPQKALQPTVFTRVGPRQACVRRRHRLIRDGAVAGNPKAVNAVDDRH
jgi:hypothetical protein